MVPKRAPSIGENAPGPFYVSDQCITCGLPKELASKNIDWKCSRENREIPDTCFIKKQPENDEELDAMVEAVWGSCVENIRYCGTDPVALEKLKLKGCARLCDAV